MILVMTALTFKVIQYSYLSIHCHVPCEITLQTTENVNETEQDERAEDDLDLDIPEDIDGQTDSSVKFSYLILFSAPCHYLLLIVQFNDLFLVGYMSR
jgi:hypothetical protein